MIAEWAHRQKEDIMTKGNGKRILLRDLGAVIVIVLTLFFILYLWTNVWPPVVVVESGSMMHGDDSSIGPADTGDLVVVKETACEDIVTWSMGKASGHERYGDYGDVIVYDKNGRGGTPIIHRALFWAEFNDTSRTYSVPEMNITGQDIITLEGITDPRTGRDLEVDLSSIMAMHENTDFVEFLKENGAYIQPHSGFITMGDANNPHFDQDFEEGGLVDLIGVPVQPVRCNQLEGVAIGEIPAIGLFKLPFQKFFSTLRGEEVPDTPYPLKSALLCWGIFLILAGPLVWEASTPYRQRWEEEKEEREAVRKHEEEKARRIEEARLKAAEEKAERERKRLELAEQKRKRR